MNLPAVLAAATVLSQIAYPLTPRGPARDRLTVTSVLLYATTSVTHATIHRGPRWAGVFLAVTAGGGLAAEAVGTKTGLPFGRYSYGDSLGPKVAGVPLVIPLAWTMVGYPAYLVGVRLGSPALVGGVALAAWDVFLDPQMVDAGHWSWQDVGATLPGVPGVPVTNYAGWLVTSTVMMAGVRRWLPAGPDEADRVPFALYCWTFASSVLANAAFWRRPAVAGWGTLAMGPVVVALLRSLRTP